MNSTDGRQTFSAVLQEKAFRHSKYFVENEKDGNHLVLSLVNMIDRVERKKNSLKPIFFSCVILAECGFALS